MYASALAGLLTFAGQVSQGCVWGRGAIDMKDMDAMILSVVRDRMRTGRRPPRDIVLANAAGRAGYNSNFSFQ